MILLMSIRRMPLSFSTSISSDGVRLWSRGMSTQVHVGFVDVDAFASSLPALVEAMAANAVVSVGDDDDDESAFSPAIESKFSERTLQCSHFNVSFNWKLFSDRMIRERIERQNEI